MAPKKKPGAATQPSSSKAPRHATTDAAGATGTPRDVDAAGDVVDACFVVITSLVAETGAGGTGEGQHQQHPNGHTLQGTGGEIIPSAPLCPAEGHSHSGGTCSGANRNPPTAHTAGATSGHAPPPEQADPANAPNGAAGPQAPPPRHHAILATGS
nr:actin cytoskeleton-regulatory complex protein PAN1-like [Aegilops tauschii subsp. strangulata]